MTRKIESMQIKSFSFETLDWTAVTMDERPGERGTVRSAVKMMNDIRVRMVEYSAGYKADHWCSKGHVLHCLEGEMQTELEDGRIFKLKAGMTYFVGDNNEPHRSSTETGCRLFIVD
jgi:quercetin dioxygenase-like cupin family protein